MERVVIDKNGTYYQESLNYFFFRRDQTLIARVWQFLRDFIVHAVAHS